MSEGIKRGQVVGSTVREALTAIIDDIGDHQVLALALISMGQPDCACLAVSFVSLMLVIALFMLPFDVFGGITRAAAMTFASALTSYLTLIGAFVLSLLDQVRGR